MSDPQDLLYTNKFISTDVLKESDLVNETKYYDRFKNYLSNTEKDETEKYVENDLTESDPVNISKTLNTKWPTYGNRNHYPLFDTYINDVSVNRYKKEIISKVNIDSKNRDPSKYLNPNNFNIPFNKVYNNIKKFIMNDLVFPNTNQSVTNVNNNFSWQYASENYLLGANIDNTIIPVPNPSKRISYSKLPNSVYSFTVTGTSTNIPNIDNYLVYQTNITPGFYTVPSLQTNIRTVSNKILHGSNIEGNNLNIIEQPYLVYSNRIGTPHLFSTSIDPISSVVRFVNRMEEIKIVAIQTFSPYENNYANSDMFYYLSSKYSITSPQILNNDYIYIIFEAINDITYQYFQNQYCIFTPNAFPLVITDLDINIGNINSNLFNFTEFYDENIYTQNGYSINDINSISTYKFIDYINIYNTTYYQTVDNAFSKKINKVYLRFAFKLSSGNLNGQNYNSLGTIIKPSTTENIVLNSSLKHYLNNSGNLYANITSTTPGNGSISINAFTSTTTVSGSASTINLSNTTGTTTYALGQTGPTTMNGQTGQTNTNGLTGTINTGSITGTTTYGSINNQGNVGTTSGFIYNFKYYDKNILVGRSLLFRFIFDKVNGTYANYEISTENEKKRSVLQILAWPIANQTLEIYTIDTNNGFKFVQTNIQGTLIDYTSISTNKIIPTNNNLPNLNLNLQYFSNQYYFINNAYVYVKLIFATNDTLTSSDQIIDAISSKGLQYDQNYIDTNYFTVGIGEDYTCIGNSNNLVIYKKDYSNIFAKILLSNVPGNYDSVLSNIINNNNFSINYDNVIDNISGVTVQVYDSTMKLLSTNNNYSFTLTIYEIKDILKETLINTKTNNVNTQGYYI